MSENYSVKCLCGCDWVTSEPQKEEDPFLKCMGCGGMVDRRKPKKARVIEFPDKREEKCSSRDSDLNNEEK